MLYVEACALETERCLLCALSRVIPVFAIVAAEPVTEIGQRHGVEFRKLLLPFPELDNCYDTWIGMVLFAVGAWKLSAAAPLTLFRRHSGSVSQSGLIPSWKEKIAQAKRSIADDTAGWNAALYSKLIERTGNLLTPEMRKLLEARQAHSQARSRMNVPFFRRLKMVLKETLNGNYFRFGRSYQNIIQDLFFRHPESKKR